MDNYDGAPATGERFHVVTRPMKRCLSIFFSDRSCRVRYRSKCNSLERMVYLFWVYKF